MDSIAGRHYRPKMNEDFTEQAQEKRTARYARMIRIIQESIDMRSVQISGVRTIQASIGALEDFGPSSKDFARREKERRVAVAKLRRQNAMNLLRIKPVAKPANPSLPAIEPREHGMYLVYETKKYGTTVTLPWLSILG